MISITLASNSPRRSELLAQAGIAFRVHSEPVEELTLYRPAALLPQINARRKAAAVSRLEPTQVVLGADTVILFQDRVIGKPADSAEALATLLALSGQTHEVVTGIALLRAADEYAKVFSVATRVTFRPYSREVAERYLREVYVLDKAGAYAIQEHGDWLAAKIEGSHSNIIGLPLEALAEALKEIPPCATDASENAF